MRKSFYIIGLLFSALLSSGCEKIPTEVVDQKEPAYGFSIQTVPARFIFNQADSTVVTAVRAYAVKGEKISIRLNIIAPDGSNFTPSPIELKDNGAAEEGDGVAKDSIYSARIRFSSADMNGLYRFEYTFVSGKTSVQTASHDLRYYNGKENFAPEILDVQMPDTIAAGVPVVIKAKVFDANGLSDIKRVFFTFTRIEDNVVSDEVGMFNDGRTAGDEVEDDDIYSYKNPFPESARGKTRVFRFRAEDRSGAKSNTITRALYIK